MVSDVLITFLRQKDPNICFPWRRNHWRHWWKMKGIKSGKEEFTTNGLTTCLPKFPVIVFKELSLFFFLISRCSNLLKLLRVCIKERPFFSHKYQNNFRDNLRDLGLYCWKEETLQSLKMQILHHKYTCKMWTKFSIHWVTLFTTTTQDKKISSVMSYCFFPLDKRRNL